MIFQLVLHIHDKDAASKTMKELDHKIKECSGKVVGLQSKSVLMEKNGMVKQLHLLSILVDIPEKNSDKFKSFLKGNKISNKVHKKKSTESKKSKSSSKKSTESKKSKSSSEKDKLSIKKKVSKAVKTVKKSVSSAKKSSKKDMMDKVIKDAKKLDKNMKKLEKSKKK